MGDAGNAAAEHAQAVFKETSFKRLDVRKAPSWRYP